MDNWLVEIKLDAFEVVNDFGLLGFSVFCNSSNDSNCLRLIAMRFFLSILNMFHTETYGLVVTFLCRMWFHRPFRADDWILFVVAIRK